jgi:nicotinamidase/pyrazinamidase
MDYATETHDQARLQPHPGDALLIVDVQNDFLPGGSLAVPRGDEVVPVLNQYAGVFGAHSLPVYATRDWHPQRHCSFHAQGGPWPPHCIADTHGAAFAATLTLPPDTTVISKATTPDEDAYSGFQKTDLDQRLRAAGIRRLFIGGLATDYCVLNTVRDARRLGYAVMLLTDAIRAVEVQPGDGKRAVAEMVGLGAQSITLNGLAA